VIASVNCRRCGYDLQGLPAAGKCPECGLDVIETLTHLVDPTASRLPRLRDPSGTGDGLVGIALMHLLTAASLLIPLLWPTLLSILALRIRVPLVDQLDSHLLAAGFATIGFLFILRLAQAPADEPSALARSFVRWMVAAQIGVTAACLLPWWMNISDVTDPIPRLIADTAVIPIAIVGLFGLRGVLGIVGLRSRAFRTAEGGRQSAKALVASLGAILLGSVMIQVGRGLERTTSPGAATPEFVQHLGMSLFAGASLLLLIGLAYMLANTWWIRASLHRPPPKLGELIGPGANIDESTTMIGDRSHSDEPRPVSPVASGSASGLAPGAPPPGTAPEGAGRGANGDHGHRDGPPDGGDRDGGPARDPDDAPPARPGSRPG